MSIAVNKIEKKIKHWKLFKDKLSVINKIYIVLSKSLNDFQIFETYFNNKQYEEENFFKKENKDDYDDDDEALFT